MHKIKKTKEKKESAFGNSLYMMGFVLKNAPLLFIGETFVNLLIELPWALSNIVLLRYIIDVFTSGVQFERIAYACMLFVGIVLVGNILNTFFYETMFPAQIEKMNYKLYSAIYEKAAKMDLASYDDPKFYNDFVLAMQSVGNKTEEIVRLIRQLTVDIVSIAMIVGVIITIDPICILMIALCVGIMLPLGKIGAKLSVKRTEAMTPYDRKNLYYWRVFYLADYAKEIRLNPAGEMTQRRYNRNIHDRLQVIGGYLLKQWGLYFCQESLPMTLVVYLGVTLYMGYRAIVIKDISLGDFTAAFNGASSVSNSVFYLTTWFSLQLREYGLYIGKYKKFMAAPETIKSGENKKIFDKPVPIKLHNVSFTYPGNSEPTLKNINLEIKPYEKIALVGYNGAGKTTLTNLLLRLYDVTEGSITADSTDIRDWDIHAYHNNFAAVFQDYSLFGGTLGENVAMDKTYDEKKVKAALSESGFSKELPEGADTVLLREFDEEGQSFSGGEAQKIAIARAFYKNCAFAILDEPSANLDPESEYALNEAMARAAKDKTVIFISHRLSTTVMADRIFMMENGEIVESGSHEELMALGGKYAYMFNLQAEKYVK